ncbi:MAG: T9SS type A sorting domain-containing protein [Bacteroidota bacterium]|nr:T9SS type A sorting domain-containing protein [Bacteroidota bacterium]
MRIILSFALFILTSTFASAINRVPASAGTASWTNPATWSPAGIPTSADNVTITSGSTITLGTTAQCVNLIIDAGGVFSGSSFSAVLSISGNYTNNGTESGIAQFAFFGTGLPARTIGGTGAFSANIAWAFNKSRTILSNVNYSRNANTKIYGGSVVTNLGTLTLNTTTILTGSSWIQGINSNLTIRQNAFFAGTTLSAGTLDCSAIGNSVTLTYTTGDIPNSPTGFNNLTLAGTIAGSKTMRSNLIVLNNLVINNLNTLNSNNFNLSIGGNFTKNGVFTSSLSRTVTMNGSGGSQSFSASSATIFTGLTINNSAGVNVITGAITLTEVLTVSNGTFNTFGNPFTMTSTAAKTARIAPIGPSGGINGSFTIQRFIGTRDSTFADLSSPVQNSTFLDWDNELPSISYLSSPPTAQSSAHTYDEIGDVYVPVTSSGQALTPGQGFEVFLTGSFDFTVPFPNTILTTVGTPNQGDQNFTSLVSSTAQSWNLVGNPFASNIHWSDIYTASGAASSGLFDFYEMYDYTIEDWNGFTSADAQEIPSTQGFWVYGDFSAAPTLIIPESSKRTTMVSDIKSSTSQKYFTLKISNADKNIRNAHSFKIAANSSAANAFVAGEDIPFRKSPNASTPALYTMIDGKKVNINTFNSSTDNYSIALRSEAKISGDYTIEAAGFDFVSDYSCVKLEDTKLNKVIDLNVENVYTFHLNSGDDVNRFIVHFSKDGNCKTPSFNTIADAFSNEIEVLTAQDGNIINFNFTEVTPSIVTVTNILGQNIINTQSVEASNQSMKINLPSDFSGMYIISIESAKGKVTKKFVRK